MAPPARIFTAVAASALWGLAPAVAPAQDVAPPLGAFLQQHLGMSATDVVALRDGRVVATLPDVGDPREIAASGVVRVNATHRAFADAVRDVATYVRGATVRQAGTLSTPPVLADLDTVTLPDADLEALRGCRVGHCGLKLPAAMLERLQRDAVWSAPDWRQQVSARVKQWIVDGAGAYLRGGYAALPEYVDQPLAVNVADETRSLVLASSYVRAQAPPEFLEQLGRPHNAATLAGMTRMLYWAVEQHGFKPTLTISEMAIYQRDPAGPVFVATTQLYATHYYEGAVTLTVATATHPASSSFDLLYLYRSRIDALRGGLFGLKRFAAGRRIRHALEATLRDTKIHLERQAASVIH